MASFEEIDEARRLLGLWDSATLKEIKQAYRRKAFCHHPDRCKGDNDEKMKSLNRAYKLLTEYCSHYKYTFTKEDVARVYPGEEYLRRYTYGWFDDM